MPRKKPHQIQRKKEGNILDNLDGLIDKNSVFTTLKLSFFHNFT